MASKKSDACCHCNTKVGNSGIQCEMCERWWHLKCAGLKQEESDIIGKYDQMHWFCLTCSTNVDRIIKEFGKIEDRLSKIEEKVTKETGVT